MDSFAVLMWACQALGSKTRDYLAQGSIQSRFWQKRWQVSSHLFNSASGGIIFFFYYHSMPSFTPLALVVPT
jgi:hypothetical protein